MRAALGRPYGRAVDAAYRTDTVATFLVERYWPGVTVTAFTTVTGIVDENVERLRAEGASIRTIASTLVPADEAAYWVVEAASADLVRLAFGRAGVPVERIVEAVDVRPGLDLRSAMDPGSPGGMPG